MGLIITVIVIIAIIPLVFFIFGRKAARNPDNIVRRYPVIAKVFIWGYVIFAGCFVYPISSEPFPLDFSKLYLLLTSYGIIGLGLAAINWEAKKGKLYLQVLVMTIAGMVCRYLLEYGEVSNTYNFTWQNIIIYIVAVPLYTVAAYHFICRYLKQNH